MAGVRSTTPTQHNTMTTAYHSCEEKTETLTETLRSFTNPFEEESDGLFNLVTKACTGKDQTKARLELFNDFVNDRIKSGKLGVWSPMKKKKLRTWRKVGKEVKVKADGKVYELKEDRSLFARLLLACKSRPEIDIKNAIGLHEFFCCNQIVIRCRWYNAPLYQKEFVDVYSGRPTT